MPVHARITRNGKLVIDLVVLASAFFLAFLIRFEGFLPVDVYPVMILSLPFVLMVKTCFLCSFGVRRLSWRHVSLPEAQKIFTSLMMATALLVAWRFAVPWLSNIFSGIHFPVIPMGVLLIDLPLSFLGVTGTRVALRMWFERLERGSGPGPKLQGSPTLLIGAGRTGALVGKALASGRDVGIYAVGFLDDVTDQVGMMIHGIPVLGTIDQLDEVVRAYGAKQALITLEHTSAEAIRRIVGLCKNCGITAKIVPDFLDVVEGKVDLSRIRDVAIEDLLRRKPVQLDTEAIASVVRGRRVMVTGAGGSIGSELCRLICRFEPATLVLVEQAENSLFFIHQELTRTFPAIKVTPCVGDICDVIRMKDLFSFHQPMVVFHAAAHKHVPLMEANPGEAVKNNVLGTRNLVDLADAFGVSEFVMISTDKAVNPTSVMGVTKRVAEIYIQALSQQSKTRFVTVRFGNVLGSAGSVIPIFKEQIARGGPVTVTHPEMQRYFMTIPEACQLVLQAAAMGKGGEIFILDMGEPVKIIDLAWDLIRLSGLVPDKDVAIRITGIRPGEKLFEELSLVEESAEKTRHPRIFVGRLLPRSWEEINRQVDELGDLATAGEILAIHAKLRETVPEYNFPQFSPPWTDNLVRLDHAIKGKEAGHGPVVPKLDFGANENFMLAERQA